MIIIETTTRERLVLVPEERIVCTEHARDATPDDLARAGYVLEAAGAEHIRAILVAAERPLLARAEKAERERDDAEHEVRTLRAKLADAKDECAGAMRSAHTQYAETVRQRDEARAELARLTAPAEGEPTDEALRDAFEVAYRDAPSECCHANAIRAIYRLGVAHERARQQPAQDRATDEELMALASNAHRERIGESVSLGDLRDLVRRVAARVRQERCLVAQAVSAGWDITIHESYGVEWDVKVTHVRFGTREDRATRAEVPSTLARLLGEVAR